MEHPIVIVGGGFGGVYTARALLRRGESVLLISENNYFTFTPLLHEVASGELLPSDVTFEYSGFFKSKNFRFVRGTVDRINLTDNRIHIGESTFSFEHLVMATGSTTHYYSMQGTQHCLTLKSLDDAVRIKQHLIKLVQGSTKNTYIHVIGAGPTGVELILEIDDLLKQIKRTNKEADVTLRLINAGERILSSFPQNIQTYAQDLLEKRGIQVLHNAIATELTPTKIKTSAGEFTTDMTILVAGVAPQTQYLQSGTLDARDHVQVNDHLQVQGYEHIFALGDIITVNDQPVPKLAQTAVEEAHIVARNIIRLKRQQPLLSYHVRLKGQLVSLGKFRGAGVIFGITVKGFLAWWLWRTVYLFKTPGLSNKLRVAFSWTLGLFTGKDLSER